MKIMFVALNKKHLKPIHHFSFYFRKDNIVGRCFLVKEMRKGNNSLFKKKVITRTSPGLEKWKKTF